MPQTGHKEGDGSFDISEALPWHIGVKIWSKFPFRTIRRHFCLGVYEFGIGPTVAWKPLGGMGFQSGLLYSFNERMTENVDLSGKVVSNWSSSVNQYKANVCGVF